MPPNVGLLELGEVIGDRYRIVRLIGQGGMGAVYEAWDDELGVPVAIKILLAQHSDDPVMHHEIERRLKKELLVARQITHKHVVRIHDIAEVRGMKFISMAYIEGEDLATIVKRGPLPVRQALGLARQVAAGLVAAHEAGVIHRDLKPGNVMIENHECAVLTDFGIARWLRSGSAQHTMTGTVSGTLEYMPPEQARGEVVDGRADVYAFGLIAYEMLAGLRRLTRDTALADLVNRMNAPPVSVRSLQPAVPEALDAVITKCLQPAPAERYATSAALVAALDALDADGRPVSVPPQWPSVPRLVLTAMALVLAAAGLTRLVVGGRAPDAPLAHAPVSLLIADFENRARDPVFDGSLEHALSIGMEGASFITAFSPSAARAVHAQFRPGAPLDEEGARLVSQREGIKIVLAGAIDLDGDEYRLTVRAIDQIAGTLVTTATATAGSKSDVLRAVNTVAARLREALGDTSTRSGATAYETFTAASLEAAQAYSRGQQLLHGAKREEAIEEYRRALRHDPNMGRAYAGWALAAAFLGRTEEAEGLYKEAFARLDRMTEREKFSTLGTYYLRVARNPEKAIENFSQLVEKYPADASALNNLAVAHFRALRFSDALEYGKRLVSVYPEGVQWRYNYALYAMYAGDFATAHEHGEEALKRNPDTPKAYLALAMAALAAGRTADAQQVWQRAAASSAQGASLAATALADLALYEGRHAAAAGILAPAIEADRRAKNTAGAATKLIAHAEVQQMAGRLRDAVAPAQEAVKISKAESIVVPAAQVLLAAGRDADALALAADLGKRLNVQARAYGKLIEGEAALQNGRIVESVETLRAGLRLADLWLLRYALGVAYVHANASAEALSELEACEKRRGEAASVFLNDEPSWRYRAPLTYWLARAREGVGLRNQASAGYKAFVALRPSSPKDPLVVDARKRAGA